MLRTLIVAVFAACSVALPEDPCGDEGRAMAHKHGLGASQCVFSTTLPSQHLLLEDESDRQDFTRAPGSMPDGDGFFVTCPAADRAELERAWHNVHLPTTPTISSTYKSHRTGMDVLVFFTRSQSAVLAASKLGFSTQQRPQMVTFNKFSREVMEAPMMEQLGALTGESQIVTVADSGLQRDNCLVHDPDVPIVVDQIMPNHRKILCLNTTYGNQTDMHGTHCSGSAVGSRFGSSSCPAGWDGVAKGAKLYFVGFQDKDGALAGPEYTPDLWQGGYKHGSRIFSNSWGSTGWFGNYDQQNIDVDNFLFDNDDALVLFAAGNEGESYDITAPSLDGRLSIGAPSNSKNVLTVGATKNTWPSWQEYKRIKCEQEAGGISGWTGGGCQSMMDTEMMDRFANGFENASKTPLLLSEQTVTSFSSRGPTASGRLKPEIVAPGNQIRSGNVSECYTYSAGTSMATPTAAGQAALLRDYFISGYHPSGTRRAVDSFSPSGYLLKGLMMHSASTLAVPYLEVVGERNFGAEDPLYIFRQFFYEMPKGPNSFRGFGRPVLSDVLFFKQSATEQKLSPSTKFGSHFFVEDAVVVSEASVMQHTWFCRVNAPSDNSASSELKVTVSWYDPAATESSIDSMIEPHKQAPTVAAAVRRGLGGDETLVNNLDMTMHRMDLLKETVDFVTTLNDVNPFEQIVAKVPSSAHAKSFGAYAAQQDGAHIFNVTVMAKELGHFKKHQKFAIMASATGRDVLCSRSEPELANVTNTSGVNNTELMMLYQSLWISFAVLFCFCCCCFWLLALYTVQQRNEYQKLLSSSGRMNDPEGAEINMTEIEENPMAVKPDPLH